MAKSPDAFRTISEVAAQLDTPAHVLRFWESKFPQIKPVKRAGGRRYYRPDDIALVAGIKVLLHDQGMTIRGVQKLLRERGAKHVATMSALPWEGVDAVEEAEDAPESLEGAAAEGTPDDGLPDPVVVGPWPRTGVEDSGAAKPEGQPEVPAPLPSQSVVPDTLVADVVALAPAPRETGSVRAGTSVAHLREAIGCADRARLRAEGVRLRPLVQRLRTLRDGTPGQPG